MAAKAAAPPGSATTETSAQSRRWASAIAVVRNQDDLAHELPGDVEIEFADALRAERVGGERLDRHVDRRVRLQRRVKRARTFRLDANDFDPAREPGGDSGDEPAAANRDENRVELSRAKPFEVLLPFQRHRALTRDRLDRIVRMDRQRAALGDVGVAALLRLGIGSRRR